ELLRDPERAADVRIARDLGAAIGADHLADQAVAGECADMEIAAAEDLGAEIDAAIDHRAVVDAAERRRIGIDHGREVLVLELAVPERAAAGIALKEPASVEIEAAEAFAGEDREVAVAQPRHQERAGVVAEILAGAAPAVPEPGADLAGVG